jgi:hypothetical protein
MSSVHTVVQCEMKPILYKLPITIGVFTLYGSVLYIIQYRTELENAEYIHTYICWYLKNTLYGTYLYSTHCILQYRYLQNAQNRYLDDLPVLQYRFRVRYFLLTWRADCTVSYLDPSYKLEPLRKCSSQQCSNLTARKVKLGCKNVMPLTVYHV